MTASEADRKHSIALRRILHKTDADRIRLEKAAANARSSGDRDLERELLDAAETAVEEIQALAAALEALSD